MIVVERVGTILHNLRHLPKIVNYLADEIAISRVKTRVATALVAPLPARTQYIERAIEDIQSLLPLRPRIGYILHAELGVCYYTLGEKEKAVLEAEQTILSHPKPNDPNFYTYSGIYLKYVRETNQQAIQRLSWRDRKRSTAQFALVIESTGRILKEHPEFDTIIQENHAARSWYQRATGRPEPNFSRISKN